jgi:hypothetical protein
VWNLNHSTTKRLLKFGHVQRKLIELFVAISIFQTAKNILAAGFARALLSVLRSLD